VQGRVAAKQVVYTAEAFDVGTIVIDSDDGLVTLHVMNEYMAIDNARGERLSTYPDVIATLDAEGRPVSVGHVKEGMELFVLHIPKANIPLSSSVRDPSVYPPVERAMNIAIAAYALS